jgi:hypothetical protein
VTHSAQGAKRRHAQPPSYRAGMICYCVVPQSAHTSQSLTVNMQATMATARYAREDADWDEEANELYEWDVEWPNGKHNSRYVVTRISTLMSSPDAESLTHLLFHVFLSSPTV